ncbi:MAG: flagellar hook assembly protein FlgD [Betaproteobacteria bacterium HGW-Betaproteobacteria-1]|nr:MAG: flagellar hook assembly protein FlgD [Betaproteobacteria bacterium HGW-Betaproteobacteria-1]
MTTVQNDNKVSNTLLDAMNGSRNTAKTTAQEAQDRFMTLLVTQMKNQDPLNPMDNAQVTSQLAQLSTVTGIDKLNNTMEALIGSVQSSQSMQASGMIGRVVLTEGNNVDLFEGDSLFAVDLPASADNVKVTIKDADGIVVREMSLGKQPFGLLELNWGGETNSGEIAADGRYFYEVSATSASGTINAVPMAYSMVNSVSNSADGIQMNLSNLKTVSLGDIKQVF